MKIAVLVSGGVDSSVALRILKDQGHDLTAFYLKIWLEDELSYLGQCPWEQDLAFVRQVCEQNEVPLQIVSLQKEYWDQVVSYTMGEIKAGRTPNPDILCNQRIKFGMFFNHIDDSFEKVATGHYAQVLQDASTDALQYNRDGDRHYRLLKAPDPIKDQTYFLAYLSQAQLSRALFPIGHLHKDQVRQLAQKYNLANKERKDSQGICFLGQLKFNDFIKHHVGERPGDIIEFETGKKLGSHKGFWFHTIGQRQGSGLAGGPWYVVKKDSEANIVYMSRDYYSFDKQRNSFIVSRCNWLSGVAPVKNELHVKIRHGKQLHNCTLAVLQDGRWQITLAHDDQGIAPGQFAVFYDDQECLGAGIIE
jgi:tRNA (5-methylaminomethyl-2-thiouridylate)-methyltransferase